MAEYEENIYPNEVITQLWDDNPLPIIPGQYHTPFGYYDMDSLFRAEAIRFSKWAARRLGYPSVDIEMGSSSFYACIEEAINEYSSIINQWNIRDNLLTLQSTQYGTETNLSQKVIKPNLGKVIEVSNEYGSEAGVGGEINWYSASIQTQADVQIYDIEEAVSSSLAEQGMSDMMVSHNIEVKRVYHQAPPASTRYFNPFIGTGNQYLMSSFGFDKISGVNYIMMPLSNDLMRMQAIEMSDTIRKSAYSFDIVNNKIRIFPKPTSALKVYFQYIFKSDRNDPVSLGNESGLSYVSDPSNVPYGLMTYSKINNPGRQWIMKWGLALSKEVLGAIRNKYQSIPSMENDIQLDGDTLRNQAQTEKDSLMTELNTFLEATSRKAQLAQKQEEAESLTNILNKVPIPIWIK